jgi:hypothetical protein
MQKRQRNRSFTGVKGLLRRNQLPVAAFRHIGIITGRIVAIIPNRPGRPGRTIHNRWPVRIRNRIDRSRIKIPAWSNHPPPAKAAIMPSSLPVTTIPAHQVTLMKPTDITMPARMRARPVLRLRTTIPVVPRRFMSIIITVRMPRIFSHGRLHQPGHGESEQYRELPFHRADPSIRTKIITSGAVVAEVNSSKVQEPVLDELTAQKQEPGCPWYTCTGHTPGQCDAGYCGPKYLQNLHQPPTPPASLHRHQPRRPDDYRPAERPQRHRSRYQPRHSELRYWLNSG